MTKCIAFALFAIVLSAQSPRKPSPKESTLKIQVCVENIEAYGAHTRFTTGEHLQILLNDKASRDAQDRPYRDWELASSSINWFDGSKPVSLSYVKSHMPRGMLLTLGFPVDPNPHIVQADVERLLEAEKKYEESGKIASAGRDYLFGLLKKYGIGPAASLDKDMGGATPMSTCAKYEEQDWPIK